MYLLRPRYQKLLIERKAGDGLFSACNLLFQANRGGCGWMIYCSLQKIHGDPGDFPHVTHLRITEVAVKTMINEMVPTLWSLAHQPGSRFLIWKLELKHTLVSPTLRPWEPDRKFLNACESSMTDHRCWPNQWQFSAFDADTRRDISKFRTPPEISVFNSWVYSYIGKRQWNAWL